MRATAYAHTNIALVKYWGKRAGVDRALNLPATGSLSLTLDRFGTETTVEVAPDDSVDTVALDGAPLDEKATARVSTFLDLLRTRLGRRERCRVTTYNDVPTAAGLASSASGFCALAVAAAAALEAHLSPKDMTQLARQGSGSAARSVFGGFVRLHAGHKDSGVDCFATPVTTSLSPCLVVVRCAKGPKETGSTVGMDHTAQTSPYYPAWVATHERDLDDANDALNENDLPKLGEVMEHNTLKMHATTLSARPGFFYFQPVTIAVLLEVRALRAAGTGAWATMDAGPHVKVLCAEADAAAVAKRLGAVAGVMGVDVCRAGPGAHLLDGPRDPHAPRTLV